MIKCFINSVCKFTKTLHKTKKSFSLQQAIFFTVLEFFLQSYFFSKFGPCVLYSKFGDLPSWLIIKHRRVFVLYLTCKIMLTSLLDCFWKQQLSVFNNYCWNFHKPKTIMPGFELSFQNCIAKNYKMKISSF